MNEFKYQFVNIILLALLGFGIYWAFSTIDNGIVYDKDTVVAESTETVTKETEEVVLFENTKSEEGTETEQSTEPEPAENSDLIAQLEALVEAKVIFKKGSNGDGVKTVQAFLDEYFTDRDITIDGDFGPGTEKLVKEFQTKELNGGDGRFGPNTGEKMLEILKNQ